MLEDDDDVGSGETNLGGLSERLTCVDFAPIRFFSLFSAVRSFHHNNTVSTHAAAHASLRSLVGLLGRMTSVRAAGVLKSQPPPTTTTRSAAPVLLTACAEQNRRIGISCTRELTDPLCNHADTRHAHRSLLCRLLSERSRPLFLTAAAASSVLPPLTFSIALLTS